MGIYLFHQSKQHGPFSPQDVRNLAEKGEFGPDTLAWTEGASDWQSLYAVLEQIPDPDSSRVTTMKIGVATGANAVVAKARSVEERARDSMKDFKPTQLKKVELEPTWPRLIAVWRSYLLRAFVTLVIITPLYVMVPVLLLLILGFMKNQLPFSLEKFQEGLTNIAIGLYVLLLPVLLALPLRMLIGKNYGDFRLVMLGEKVEASSDGQPES